MTIFGVSADLPIIISHVVFIGFFLFLIVLEKSFSWLDVLAERQGLVLLFEKLKTELMFMGIISFVVFVYTLITGTPDSDPTFVSFEMAHMVVFFMAIAFILQAVFLTGYASIQGKTFIMALRTSTSVLIKAYDNLKPVELHRFLHTSPYFPSFYPPLRSTIEFRIIERLFIAQVTFLLFRFLSLSHSFLPNSLSFHHRPAQIVAGFPFCALRREAVSHLHCGAWPRIAPILVLPRVLGRAQLSPRGPHRPGGVRGLAGWLSPSAVDGSEIGRDRDPEPPTPLAGQRRA